MRIEFEGTSQVSVDNRFSILDATVVFFLFLSFATYQYFIHKANNTRSLSFHAVLSHYRTDQTTTAPSISQDHVTERANETLNDQSLLDPSTDVYNLF